MKRIIAFYRKYDKVNFYALVFTVICIISIFFIFLINKAGLPSKLPLYYSLPWGEAQLVEQNQFMILPAIISAITLINSIISWQLHESQLHIKRIIHLTTAALALLCLITTYKIVHIFI